MEEDYKHSAPGKIVSQKYADLLFQSPPEPPEGHPRMSPARRAKIFSPFAALRGYEEEIEAEANDHLRIPRKELSEERKTAFKQSAFKPSKRCLCPDPVFFRYFQCRNLRNYGRQG